jgi:hypothetical protein
MLKTLIILALLGSAFGQLGTMDQIPTIRQSNQNDSNDSLAFTQNVVSGNVLIAKYYTFASITTPTIADTRSCSWTLRITSTGSAGTIYVWTCTLGSSGADTVTITESGASFPSLGIIEAQTVTELVDGTATAANAIAAGQLVTFPNVTTTHYRDLILDIMAGANAHFVFAPTNAAYSADIVAEWYTSSTATQFFQAYLSGNPGTVTGPTMQVSGAVAQPAVQGVLALRSTSALTVSTPSIPDAVVSQSYSFQMQATGGLGTNSWTTTAGTLPCGLSLASSGVISGTPTCSNGNTITFQVTDTAAATATKNLTLHVGNSASTITRVQGVTGGSLTGVTSGNMILFGVLDTAAFASLNLQNPRVTDGFGSIYTPIPCATISSGGSGYTRLYWGFAAGSGNTTIAINPASTSGSSWASEWTNVQPVFDTGVCSQLSTNSGSSPISSGTITAPVAEMLYSMAIPGTNAATITVNSPFTRDINLSAGATPAQVEADYEIGSAAGSQSASYNQSGNTGNLLSMTLLGFRPTVSGTAPLKSGRSRAQVY